MSWAMTHVAGPTLHKKRPHSLIFFPPLGGIRMRQQTDIFFPQPASLGTRPQNVRLPP